MKGMVLVVLLVGCSAAAPPMPASQPVPVVEEAAPVPSPALVPVADVVRAYQAARKKEIPAVSVPGVTADYITNVHNLEVAARDAVHRLVAKRTPEALTKARSAVTDLAAAINAPPP